MGTSNYKLGLEQRLARLKGELKDIRSEVGSIESTLTRLPSLHQRASAVETAIAHLESLLQFDYPDWRSEKVKPYAKHCATKADKDAVVTPIEEALAAAT